MLDSSGIIRIAGRQNALARSYDSIHPIILSGKPPVIKLLIRSEHIRLLHAGPSLVHGSLSHRFHVVGGYKVIRVL